MAIFPTCDEMEINPKVKNKRPKALHVHSGKVCNDLQPDFGTRICSQTCSCNHRFFSVDSVCCTYVCFLSKMGQQCNISLQHLTST